MSVGHLMGHLGYPSSFVLINIRDNSNAESRQYVECKALNNAQT